MHLENRNILVAGASGFLGGAMVDRLLAEGATVRGTHFSRPPTREHPRLSWLHGDLRQPADCARAVDGMEIVIHAAANTSGVAVITTTPMVHVTPNIVLNSNLLQAAYDAKVSRFLFLSSGAAYPDLGPDHRLAEADMFKADPPDVYFPAGWMKRYTEILCRTYAEKLRRSMPCTVLRPSNVYGPGDKVDFQQAHVTAAQIRRVVERHRPIEVWGMGDDVRDIIYVDDFTDCAIRALAVDEAFFVTNVAAGHGWSVRDIVETAIRVDGFADAEIVFDANRPRSIAIRLFDVSLARRRLGFEATTSLETGMARTMAWLRRSGELDSIR